MLIISEIFFVRNIESTNSSREIMFAASVGFTTKPLEGAPPTVNYTIWNGFCIKGYLLKQILKETGNDAIYEMDS